MPAGRLRAGFVAVFFARDLVTAMAALLLLLT
jgi:hypothetical protein